MRSEGTWQVVWPWRSNPGNQDAARAGRNKKITVVNDGGRQVEAGRSRCAEVDRTGARSADGSDPTKKPANAIDLTGSTEPATIRGRSRGSASTRSRDSTSGRSAMRQALGMERPDEFSCRRRGAGAVLGDAETTTEEVTNVQATCNDAAQGDGPTPTQFAGVRDRVYRHDERQEPLRKLPALAGGRLRQGYTLPAVPDVAVGQAFPEIPAPAGPEMRRL